MGSDFANDVSACRWRLGGGARSIGRHRFNFIGNGLRKHRLLELDDEGGAAVVESVAAMLLLLVLVLGVIQVAFFLYSRNVVRASAHEGARAALELGRTPEEASLVAERTVRRAVGGVVGDMEVRTETRSVDGTSRISVFVRAEISGFGPFPFPAEMVSIAHVSRPTR